ncbi:hypothetical protein GCM10020221_32450 [Streptomyces thioluteus]|uniref:Cysteine dioxygenase n=1 Tax=Streptomyces thioluteus TaxID=66431 RepID=A0ABP6JKF2_STRTU
MAWPRTRHSSPPSRSTPGAAPGSGWRGRAGARAWLIGWPPGTGTGWHDHGGSHGAFATAAGQLTEQSLAAQLPTEGWTLLELAEGVDRERQLTAQTGRAFGPRTMSTRCSTPRRRNTRCRVHAYYPPLPLMRRYGRTGRVLRLEEVEWPEEWA